VQQSQHHFKPPMSNREQPKRKRIYFYRQQVSSIRGNYTQAEENHYKYQYSSSEYLTILASTTSKEQ